MRFGVSFLQSKIARRFCVLFILSAFIPTVLLVVFSYNRVIGQIEEQSFTRLKREAKAYGISLFDRMIRIDNELRSVVRTIENGFDIQHDSTLGDHTEADRLFNGIVGYFPDGEVRDIEGTISIADLQRVISDEHLHGDKPFIVSMSLEDELDRLFFGVNVTRSDGVRYAVVGEVNPSYLWGIGINPLLPPMTDLAVFDSYGEAMVVGSSAPFERYRDIKKHSVGSDLHVFTYQYEGRTFFGSYSNIFIESRFQRAGWVIIISQARDDVMSALEGFKTTFPLVVMLFMLVILYVSLRFIRAGLEPLEKLKAGTKQVAQKDYTTKVSIDSDDEFEELGNAFNHMTTKIEQQFHTLNVLSEIDRSILSSLHRSEIVSTTLLRMKDFFYCDVALFVKWSSDADKYLKMYMMHGRRKSDPVIEYLEISQEERAVLFCEQDHIVFEEQESKPSFLKSFHGKEYATFWSLPITIDGRVERAVLLGWKDSRLTEDDELKQARQITNQLRVALTNSRLLENLEKLAKGTVEALARTVDAKSKWTSGHSERVAEMGSRISKAMGFSEKDQETLKRGGLLHDIGKIGISLSILDKPGRLTDEEYTEVKNHPEIGGKILEPIAAYQDILPLVVQHHEKFDGTGYPLGLRGEEIDARARILAVADVWDALVSDRPYREGWVHDRARSLIVEKAGQDFDPEVVKAFLVVIAEGM